jgi:thermostable 8-oxoguanine DNA glycosylase
MITPTTITNYNRTEAELEEFLMFAILVAGKGAEQQAKKLDAFLKSKKDLGLPSDTTPFQYLTFLCNMQDMVTPMKVHKLGQYKRIGHAFKEILKFKGRLSKVTIEQLESIKGIGSKTARFFILHSRPDANVAVLDTHILKWMSEKGYKSIPKATPPKKKYAEIEKLFLQEAINHQMTPADLDLTIWKSYATKA